MPALFDGSKTYTISSNSVTANYILSVDGTGTYYRTVEAEKPRLDGPLDWLDRRVNEMRVKL